MSIEWTMSPRSTTPKQICSDGFRWFVGTVWAAAPTKPSLQIMYLQGQFPDRPTNRFVEATGVISRPYKSICRGGWYYSRPYKLICRGGCSTSCPYNTCLYWWFSIEPSLQYIFRKKIKFIIQIRPEHIYIIQIRPQAQGHYINYHYKSNSQEYIQSIIKQT